MRAREVARPRASARDSDGFAIIASASGAAVAGVAPHLTSPVVVVSSVTVVASPDVEMWIFVLSEPLRLMKRPPGVRGVRSPPGVRGVLQLPAGVRGVLQLPAAEGVLQEPQAPPAGVRGVLPSEASWSLQSSASDFLLKDTRLKDGRSSMASSLRDLLFVVTARRKKRAIAARSWWCCAARGRLLCVLGCVREHECREAAQSGHGAETVVCATR